MVVETGNMKVEISLAMGSDGMIISSNLDDIINSPIVIDEKAVGVIIDAKYEYGYIKCKGIIWNKFIKGTILDEGLHYKFGGFSIGGY